MNKTFASVSFDLSSTPDVVRTLPPTVGVPLHNTALTLARLKTLGRLTFPANPLHSATKNKRRGTINSYWGRTKNNQIILVRSCNMIDSYGFGHITINGKRYTNDVIVFSDRVKDNWWRKEGHQLQIEDIEAVVNEKPEVLVVGTGYYGLMKVPAETVEFLKSKGVELIAQKTRDACTTYNRLVESGKKVIATLHLTC